jgi:hypothetical protein
MDRQRLFDSLNLIVNDDQKVVRIVDAFDLYLIRRGYCPTHLTPLKPDGFDMFGEERPPYCSKCCEGSENDIPF